MRVSESTLPHPDNPRRISARAREALTASLAEFGDLAGLIKNRRTGHLVGGNQRGHILADGEVAISRRFDPATRTGTVAEGAIEYQGERYAYREVDWDERKEKAALIAANKHGGEWNMSELTDLLIELDAGDMDLELTGFDAKELKTLVINSTVQNRGPSGKRKAGEFKVVVLFESAEDRLSGFQRLEELGYNCKPLAGR